LGHFGSFTSFAGLRKPPAILDREPFPFWFFSLFSHIELLRE
jgi:hypothetical protein